MTENNPGFQPPQWQASMQQPPVQQPPVQQQSSASTKRGALSVVTLVASFFIGYLTLILGIFALRQNWASGTRGNGMAWAGIIIGAVLGTVQFFIFYTIVNAFTQGAS